MSKHEKYTPKHAAPRPARRAAARTAARGTVLASVAVTATGAAVGTGVVVSPVATVATIAAGQAEEPASVVIPAAAGRETRDESLSRSDRRAGADPDKAAALDAEGGNAVTRSEQAPEDPRDIARALLPGYGWADQFGCLDSLWVSESDWEVDADNPTSSAYGIPQALTQLHDLPAGYMTDAEVQIRWGLDYIADSYGSPCNAWSFKQGNNWY